MLFYLWSFVYWLTWPSNCCLLFEENFVLLIFNKWPPWNSFIALSVWQHRKVAVLIEKWNNSFITIIPDHYFCNLQYLTLSQVISMNRSVMNLLCPLLCCFHLYFKHIRFLGKAYEKWFLSCDWWGGVLQAFIKRFQFQFWSGAKRLLGWFINTLSLFP